MCALGESNSKGELLMQQSEGGCSNGRFSGFTTRKKFELGRRLMRGWDANLPAGIGRKTGDLHSIYGSTRTRWRGTISWSIKGLLVTRPSGKLNGKTLSFEVASI